MLKFFYRLTRRRGVVLFVVIAIMTLLIAMATTAYFTARSSYKTVISNYNFSQMYLAATSVSDMMIDAVTQSAQKSDATSAADKTNYFKALRDAINGLKTKTPGTADAQFMVLSENIESLYTGGSISDAAVFKALENAQSTEPGILDAVKVVVALDRIAWEEEGVDKDGKPLPSYSGSHTAPASSGLSKYYYTFTTTAYYRQNSITVQDTIYNLAGTYSSTKNTAPDFSTFFTSTGQQLTDEGDKEKGERAVIIDCDEISDKSYFQSRVTIFSSSTRPNKFLGGVTTSGALYLCGQVRTGTSGKLPAPGKNAKGDYDRHDWFIGGDMFILNTNTGLDLNGNNLYVKGDLVVGSNNGVHAANIFVEGNVYILTDQAQVQTTDGGLYVKGNIYGGSRPQNHYLSNAWAKRDTTQVTIKDSINYIINRINDAKARSGGSFSYDGNAVPPERTESWWSDSYDQNKFSGKIYLNGTISGWHNNAPSKTGPYKPESIEVDIATQQQKFDTYTTVKTTVPLSTVFDTTNNNSPMRETKFANYTSTLKTLQNTLNIDFSKYDSSLWNAVKVVVDGKTSYGTLTFETADGDTVTAITPSDDPNNGEIIFTFTAKDGQTVTVKSSSGTNGTADVYFHIPWCVEGYNLYIQGTGGNGTGFPFGSNNNLTYKFGTKASTFKEVEEEKDGKKTKKIVADPDNAMPVVLRGNFAATVGEAKTKDKKGYNSFSWKGSNYNNNGCSSRVVLVDNDDFSESAVGEVVFEMGNISNGWSGEYTDPQTGSKTNVTFAAGDYMFYRKPYKNESDVKVKPVASCVTYFMSQKDFVGTLAQWNGASSNPYQFSTYDSFYSKGSDPKPEYDSRIMLISNENGGTAINDYRLDNVFCGYIYAPNGSLYSYGDGKMPIFGGMIVSDYAAIDAYYYYAEPDPRYVTALTNAMEDPEANDDGKEEKTPDDGFWYTYGTEFGRNYLG